ncbi:MAG: galactokinase [Bacillota bacterium]|nr:galactokinase [Bacillota bacterium]
MDAELRWHPLLGQWVISAPRRQERTYKPTLEDCPFCPGKPGEDAGMRGTSRGCREAGGATEIPVADYQVAVLENRFPSLSRDAPAYGVCEVVLYTSRHEGSFATLSPGEALLVVEAWTDRYRDLCADPGIEYVYVFENRGEAVGVTLHHPHGQIYAYPFLPPVPARELELCRQHYRERGSCLVCDLVRQEAGGERVVVENEHFVAFVPAFARYPYEVMVVPRSHRPSLLHLDGPEREALAAILQAVVRRYDGLFGFPFPYVMAVHQAPASQVRNAAPSEWAYSHLHVEFYPPYRTADRLKYLAGSEAGAGVFINDGRAEEKARELRQADSPPPVGPRVESRGRLCQRAWEAYAVHLGGEPGAGRGLVTAAAPGQGMVRAAAPEGGMVTVAAPGRVNLLGEHTDYNDGFVLPVAIDRWVVACGTARPDRLLVVHADLFGETVRLPLERGALPGPGQTHAWVSYVAGPLVLLGERLTRSSPLVLRGEHLGARPPPVFLGECRAQPPGLNVALVGNVPARAGLASSAAVEIATLVLARTLWHADIGDRKLAVLARQAEGEFAGVECGVMDQLCALMAREGHALFLDCRDLSWSPVPVPEERYRIVLADSGVSRALVQSEYNLRREQCRAAVSRLRQTYPAVRSLRDVTPEMLEAGRDALGDVLWRRARHVVEENERVREGAGFLRRKDAASFGRLMVASHRSLRDFYQVSCPELDQLVELMLTLPGTAGARLTGAGFGGFVVGLVEMEAVPRLLGLLQERYYAPRGITELADRVLVCGAVSGATVVGISSR